ncbi:unannotated protein [freshwater metagenome]|uniref:DNA repair protein RecN n=1 Tax=freshwater metagenome TaxID=449393 RepID=A0A6J6QJV7_9ZZZZ|nr:DNA repair protein RecN [Actinomycetota bacterium]MSW62528.1 DNA repair protein RecN [Actinomycetota bacterium]MSX89471.1 DNA repair protein RecN [Actinomycetota bacterium]MSZ64168.1 DNA repair protein RecN [Actinomycetota bacterium]MTA57864.1 DNA repair protein RecN [Actinomycetota bacterium]
MSERTLLDEITIRSIGVIDQATLEISPGLTVLTGETGAGKTMVLTALNLILGGKADIALVRKGSERMIASGRFTIPERHCEGFEEAGVVIEDGELIMTRSVSADGKSKASSNGISVTASVLTQVSELLIEIHAQSANASIGKAAKQRELLDRFAGEELAKSMQRYSQDFSHYHALKLRIAELRKNLDKAEQELGQLRDFAKAFAKLNFTTGEYAEILAQIERLSNVEELRIAAATARDSLDGEITGALSAIALMRRALDSARSKDVALDAIYANTSEAFFLLDDVRSSLASYLDSLEADPAHLDALNTRAADIKILIKKYGGSGATDFEADELVGKFLTSASAIADLEGGDDRLKELELDLSAAKKAMLGSAQELTKLRGIAASALSAAVTDEVRELAMPHTSFIVKIASADYAALKESDFTSVGCDEISMYISSHKDGPQIALAKGASGGEMSRVMLALEVVIAGSHPVGTYVFDEVDAGVGGKAAIEVGRRLYKLSQHAQVIVVTHLPQVAAWADSHFVVEKDETGTVSQSDVRKVTGDDRIEEIARMLAGLENSVSAREHATELLSLRL